MSGISSYFGSGRMHGSHFMDSLGHTNMPLASMHVLRSLYHTTTCSFSHLPILTGYEDYLRFLCSTPGINHHEISNYTRMACNSGSVQRPADLNSPSIAISHLHGIQTFARTVTNVAGTETYVITSRMSPEVALEVRPPAMTLRPGASRKLYVTLTARSVTGSYSFGEILMKGSRGHKVRIPVVAMGFSR